MEKFAILHETEEHGQILMTRITKDGEHFIRATFILDKDVTDVEVALDNDVCIHDVFEEMSYEQNAVKMITKLKENKHKL
ncbi:hypothetical protein ACT4R9_09310 [Ornithobacterium rhinotracheale]|uniref:hypothetical protein n=2 Tax=Ornithobacterium rhinotracheale TaxID=28251 RepID=UPI001FF2F89B|nr:hypothetical protein [Ornithobacterium rhinotracheale]MCK0203683.1 hypothetical protein [Ornithobacterium rhinotracheale]